MEWNSDTTPYTETEQKADFAALMRARTIVVIGASAGEDIQLKLTSRPLKFLQKFGFQGRVYGINPKYSELDGVPCYPSVLDVPGAVDLAAIFLPKPRILKAVEECGNKSVKAIVIFSSGYGETGEQGKRDEEELVRVARSHGMRIVGPNASAVVNVANGMVLSFLTAFLNDEAKIGNIAFASNSGALLSTGITLIRQKGSAFSLLAATGNESDLTMSDFVSYAVDDPGTSVIAAFVEGIKDGPGLIGALQRAASQGKPVVVVKVGGSERGEKVAASHTGAITGNDQAYSAAFRQLGVTRVRDITELVDVASLFARFGIPDCPNVAIISVGSGGAAEMMADLAEVHGLKLADFAPEIKSRLPELLTPFSILVNPIDIAGMTSDLNEEPLLYRRLMEFLLAQPSVGIFGLIIPYLPYMKQLAQHVVELLRTTRKPIVPILTGTEEDSQCIEIFRANGVPFFSSPDQGARGLKALQGRAIFANKSVSASLVSSTHEARKLAARREMERLLRAGRSTFTLFDGRAILEAYGLRLPKQGLARSEAEACKIAAEISFPVVMKVESAKILHKTEIGGVRVGVGSLDEVEKAFSELSAAANEAAGSDALDGVLVQQMVKPHTEVIVGSSHDVGLGHVLLVGMGGTSVEIFKEFALRLPPIDMAEARSMIAESRLEKLLSGYRGKPPADLDALTDFVVNFSILLCDLGDLIDEVEINPIFVLERGEGALVGDALFTLRPLTR